MKLRKSWNKNLSTWENKNNQTAKKEILKTIEDDNKNKETLPRIYPEGKQEATITGIFQHYYKNTSTIGFTFGAYNALVDQDKNKAESYFKKWLEDKPLSPWELLFICERDHVLSQDKLKVFKSHLQELNKVYDEFILFKKEQINKIVSKFETSGITESLIDDVDNLAADLSVNYHKVILYFEKIEFPDLTEEMDTKKFKELTLELINDHNRESKNKKVTPIQWYGDTNGNVTLYRALWSDDQKSTHNIGFMHDWKELRTLGWKEPITLRAAIEKLKKDLKNIV